MNSSNRVAALSLANEKQKRDGKGGPNKGGLVIDKQDGSGAYGADVAALLTECNGVYAWDRSSPTNGEGVFNNIYQAMAADIHAPGGSIRDRVQASEEYENDVRSGIATLARWLDTQWGVALYRCTSPGSGNKVTAVTVHAEYIVDEATGLTAAEAQYRRDRRATQGQFHAAYARLGRQVGEGKARAALRQCVKEALEQKLPAPVRNLQNLLEED